MGWNKEKGRRYPKHCPDSAEVVVLFAAREPVHDTEETVSKRL